MLRSVAYMYLKVALRISELESTDNLLSPYSINLSIRAFERFGKSYGCNVEFTLSKHKILQNGGFRFDPSERKGGFLLKKQITSLVLGNED